jgi:cyclophilin family peptidyl-prolyl cis-trans isomerase
MSGSGSTGAPGGPGRRQRPDGTTRGVRRKGSQRARPTTTGGGSGETSSVSGSVRPGKSVQATRPDRHLPVALLGGLALVVIVLGVAWATGALGGRGGSGGGGPTASSSDGATGVDLSDCPTSQPAALPAGQTRTMTIATDFGDIVIGVDGSLSPIAAGNIVALASCGYYDGVVFHRVVPGFVVQGGDGENGRVPVKDPSLLGTGGPGYTIQDEPVTATYGRGVVAMARSAQPNSVGSQFFIVLDDAARDQLASYNTYQIIGSVKSGIDVVDAIAAQADQEIPSSPVVMRHVTVANP